MVSFGEARLLVLLALPAAAAAAAVSRHLVRQRQQRELASPAVWDRVMGGVPATGLLRLLAWCAAAAMIVLALARPQWGELEQEASVQTRDLVLAIDVSDSMLAADLPPSRLARGVETGQRLLPLLEGNRVGVVVFAGEAYPLVPLTTDLDAVSAFLDGVSPGMVGQPGSNLERAVAASLELLPPDGEGRVVVLVTDGENLQGDVDAAVAAVERAGVGVLTVVAGTERGGPIPVPGPDGGIHHKRDGNGQPVITRAHPEVLAAIADAVDGASVELADREVVHRLATLVEGLRTREAEATRAVHRIERFPLFLGAAAGLLVTGFLLSPWRRLAAAAMVLGLIAGPAAAQQDARPAAAPHAPPAPGAGSSPAGADSGPPAAGPADDGRPSLWQRLVPGGSRRLAREGVSRWRAGEVVDAARSFAGAAALDPEDPARLFDLGTALGAAGEVEGAQPLLERAHADGVPGAAYNLGTAALVAQQAEPAVRWLREALRHDPDDAETKRNYELALALLEQQQQQQQQQQQDQDEEKPEEQPEQPPEEPSPDGAPPTPTPTPADNEALFSALERAEAEAREAMQTPTPQAGKVEKDW